ncbi:MAG: hypothetical protein IPP48_10655 [Chitinophagaceae bacterium]|nr:hypothetical protein [Chitinophagaceae bacterium]
MFKSVFIKHTLPFLFWFLSFVGVALLSDYLLHLLNLVWVGRYLGLTGTVLLIISFVYSLRKRKIITSGTPKKLLALHEYLAWIGSVLLLIHSGIHFNAITPWLATFTLIIVVAFGIVGKLVLKDATVTLNDRKKELALEGLSKEAIDKKLFFDSIMVDTMKKWRKIHLPIAFVFLCFSLIHIISILIFT